MFTHSCYISNVNIVIKCAIIPNYYFILTDIESLGVCVSVCWVGLLSVAVVCWCTESHLASVVGLLVLNCCRSHLPCSSSASGSSPATGYSWMASPFSFSHLFFSSKRKARELRKIFLYTVLFMLSFSLLLTLFMVVEITYQNTVKIVVEFSYIFFPDLYWYIHWHFLFLEKRSMK